MKMRVKLYGALGLQFPDYRRSEDIEVEIPEGTAVKDLLARLESSESQGAVVAMEGRIVKANDTMRYGVPVNVLQAIHGGWNAYASEVHESAIANTIRERRDEICVMAR